MPPLTAAQWRAVESRLGAQALFRARLLAGEMPAEIEQVFADAGTPLFPASARDLAMDCNCPDWGVPCKHLAAVCYVLAEAFDDDPFAMLAWRGKTRDELLAALRGAVPVRRRGRRPRPADDRRAAWRTAARRWPLLADVAGRPLAESLADFWSPGLSQARLRAVPPSPVTPPDLLLRLAEPPGVEVRGQPLRDLLADAYRRLAGEPGDEDAEDGAAESLFGVVEGVLGLLAGLLHVADDLVLAPVGGHVGVARALAEGLLALAEQLLGGVPGLVEKAHIVPPV